MSDRLRVDRQASCKRGSCVSSAVAESHEKAGQDSCSGCAERVWTLGCKRSVLLVLQVMLVCVTLPRGGVVVGRRPDEKARLVAASSWPELAQGNFTQGSWTQGKSARADSAVGVLSRGEFPEPNPGATVLAHGGNPPAALTEA